MANGVVSRLNRSRIGDGRGLRILQAIVLVVVVLYFGAPLLIPVAFAILLTFLLAPAVDWFEARHFPRVAAVLVVAALIFACLTLVGLKISGQFVSLVNELNTYQENIRTKIKSLRDVEPGVLKRIGDTLSELTEDLDQTRTKFEEAPNAKSETDAKPEPMPVQIVPQSQGAMGAIRFAFGSFAGPLANCGMVAVLVVFMLLTKEDLRNRLVRLVGTRQVSLTTKTMDELGSRISRYLLLNAVVNGSFGFAIGLGLWAIGVHYPALWGFLAAILRFIPYVGPIVASVLPIALSVAQSPGWTQPVLTISLFVVLELVTNNAVEPLVYGKSAGISTVALLLSTIFWVWIWGPIGLILSVPLTVVLAVLGKYLPVLEPLWILLGDEAPLEPPIQYYQRLLAADSDEAADVATEFSLAHSPADACDEVLLPALVLAEIDHERGELPDTTQEFIWSATGEVLDEILPEATEVTVSADVPLATRKIHVVGVAAQDVADELALSMLARLIPDKIDFQVVKVTTLAGELVKQLATRPPALVCISSLGPVGNVQTRYLCKRLRTAFPTMPIVTARWAFSGDRQKLTKSMAARGATAVVTSLKEALDALSRLQLLDAESIAVGTSIS